MKTFKEALKTVTDFIGMIWYNIQKVLVYGFYFVEVVAWDYIGEPVYRRLSALKIMDRFKAWVNSVDNRYALLTLFLSTFILMEVSSTYGLIFIGTGALFTGIGLYSMKLLLTVPAVTIWQAGKKPLLSFILIKWGFGITIKIRRSKMYYSAKRQIKNLRIGAIKFKDEYLNGDGEVEFTETVKSIYKELKA